MRFYAAAIVFTFLAGTVLHAQTNAAPPGRTAAERENWMIAFLTPAQQEEYAKAHEKALANDPALKLEGETLKQQAVPVIEKGTASDKQMFLEKMTAHRQKLREAMLKVDPGLVPIFKEIDKRISEARSKTASSSH